MGFNVKSVRLHSRIQEDLASDHGNADALRCLPAGPDSCFDGEEGKADTDCMCSIKTIGLQLNPGDPSVLPKETAKDQVLATVVCYTCEVGL